MENNEIENLVSGFKGEEGELIPLLQRVQGRLGYISAEAVSRISRFLRISENQIFGVASFYSQFRFIPPGRNSIRVCSGTACHVRGGQILGEMVERQLGISPGQTTPDQRFDFQRVACLGCCALAPVVQINTDVYSRMTVTRLREIVQQYE
ncbi:MAG: NADH-quinone oxidoreductase subunit NuoE [Desulfomonilaceae bacterium]